jgi:hypothetical protein
MEIFIKFPPSINSLVGMEPGEWALYLDWERLHPEDRLVGYFIKGID